MNLNDFLRQLLGDQPWVDPLLDIISIFAISTFCLLVVIFLIWLERKVIARMQDRIGPNRVGGRYGLLQTVADVLKLLTKEQITPSGADYLIYNVAPILTVMAALLVWAVMPFAPGLIGVDLNVGLFYILAVSSVSVVTILLAGWGSNNKYALLGAFRAVAQLVSYEVPMIMALLVPIILARTMSTVGVIEAQTVPYLFMVPIAAIIFFISALAETGRTPFDLLEADSEIVAGFHIEYSGMKFGMFFLAEFISTLFMSGLFAVVFMGGWNIPVINLILSAFGLQPIDLTALGVVGSIVGLIVFFTKMFLVYMVFIWIRGTWPRVRVDQILIFNWKFLVPLVLALILIVAVLDKLIPDGTSEIARASFHLASNVLLAFITLEILRRNARRQRRIQAEQSMAAVEETENVTHEVAEAAHAH
ncbi:MAG: NADH-quinone oxidoreductase subunit NuoH [Chloroflexi bacterium]|jgi:NADH-quinone oxidoreductase subunit H|nr:NADH-quinone oxidoreductase subunit NuoH [Chloroflexota bacterium]